MNVSFGDAECLLNGNECNWSLCGVLTWKVGVVGSLFVLLPMHHTTAPSTSSTREE